MRKWVLLLLCCLTATGFAWAETTDAQLAVFLRHANSFEIPESFAEQAHKAFQPLRVDCGGVAVSIDELLYDGVWMYASARAWAIDPASTLLMPGSAAREERVNGMNGEQERTDSRSFAQEATEDHKQLLAVYVYPKNLEDIGEYFLDHFQRAGDVSVLISGGETGAVDKLSWLVEVHRVDTVTGEYQLLERAVSEAEALTAPAEQSVTYGVAGHPTLSEVRLRFTGLNAYLSSDDVMDDEWYEADIGLRTADGQEIADGSYPTVSSFRLQSPEQACQLIWNGKAYPMTRK